MTDIDRLNSKHGTIARNGFRRTAILLICLLVCQGAAVFATGIPDPSDQDLGMLRFVGSGAIQIEVVDPDGLTVSRSANEIDGATFTDEDAVVTIEIPQRKIGDYQVDVNLDGSSSRLQRFDVWVTDGITTVHLAESEFLANAPLDPYVVRSDAAGFDLAPEAEDEPSGLSSTLIIIIVAAAVVLVGGGVFFLRKRKR